METANREPPCGLSYGITHYLQSPSYNPDATLRGIQEGTGSSMCPCRITISVARAPPTSLLQTDLK